MSNYPTKPVARDTPSGAVQRWRKKPVVIEAVQFTPQTYPEVFRFAREAIVGASVDHLELKTLEGSLTASPGDWIIKGVKGEFYPCKPDIFEATYESAE